MADSIFPSQSDSWLQYVAYYKNQKYSMRTPFHEGNSQEATEGHVSNFQDSQMFPSMKYDQLLESVIKRDFDHSVKT